MKGHTLVHYVNYERITCITHVIHSIQLLELASENVKINSQITCHNLCKLMYLHFPQTGCLTALESR